MPYSCPALKEGTLFRVLSPNSKFGDLKTDSMELLSRKHRSKVSLHVLILLTSNCRINFEERNGEVREHRPGIQRWWRSESRGSRGQMLEAN